MAWVLLAHIVEQVSGERYASFLAEHIFRPLDMNSTGAGNSAPKPEQQAMFTTYAPAPGSGEDMTDVHYGYGWFIARLHGHRIIYHPGDNAGFQALKAWFPDDDTIVILLANDDHVNLNRIGVHLASGLLG